jgi:hypothetical protein
LSGNEIATLAIALLGVVLSALSLGWQAATFFLEGGRIKAVFQPGFSGGAGVVTMPMAQFTDQATINTMMSQGFTQAVVAIRVRNVGRLPVTVASWSVVTRPGVVEWQPIGAALGPRLPHRLEAGESEMWATDFGSVRAMVVATASVKKIPPNRMRVGATVSLGDGRTVKAKGRF